MNRVVFYLAGVKIEVKQGDITEEKVDAVVNAANNRLLMGGGVAGAIRRKGGEVIQEEAKKKGPIEVGEAAITGGGNLPAKYVIHAATMEMDFQTDARKIRFSARNALLRAQENNIASIAFPALGCGVGGFATGMACEIIFEEVFSFLTSDKVLKDVRLVMFEERDFVECVAVVEKHMEQLSRKTFRNPVPTVDVIIAVEGGIVLIKRKNYPPGWAIPGGFVDYGESLEDAAVREAKEETGLDVEGLEQFHAYSRPGRDPRVHTISTVFTGRAKGLPQAADDAAEAGVFTKDSLPAEFAFDHRMIVEEYFRKA